MADTLERIQLQGRPIKAIINSVLHGGIAMLAGGLIDSFFPLNRSAPLTTKLLELALQNAAGGLVLAALIDIGFSPDDPMQGAYIVVPFILSQPAYIERVHELVSEIKAYVHSVISKQTTNHIKSDGN